MGLFQRTKKSTSKKEKKVLGNVITVNYSEEGEKVTGGQIGISPSLAQVMGIEVGSKLNLFFGEPVDGALNGKIYLVPNPKSGYTVAKPCKITAKELAKLIFQGVGGEGKKRVFKVDESGIEYEGMKLHEITEFMPNKQKSA